jgi:hypothetical protein
MSPFTLKAPVVDDTALLVEPLSGEVVFVIDTIPDADIVVKAPELAVELPIGPGEARFKYPDTFQLAAVVPDVKIQMKVALVPAAIA